MANPAQITPPAAVINVSSTIKGKNVPITAITPMERLVPKPTPAILQASPNRRVPTPQMMLNITTKIMVDGVRAASPSTAFTL